MSFAKALQFKGNECLVKASECRKFRQQLRTQFPLLSSEQLERIWPNKSQLRQQQLQGRTTIYICNEQPIFYVHERALYPSLYFLHVAPQIMTAVALAKGVAPALLRGADVFMPGVVVDKPEAGHVSWVVHNFGKFAKGDLVWVSEIPTMWPPLAIAKWTLSYDEMEMRGQKGKGLEVVHIMDDQLWLAGNGQFPLQRPDTAVRAVQQYEEQQLEQQLAAAQEARLQLKEKRLSEAQAYVANGPNKLRKQRKLLRQIQALCDRIEAGEQLVGDSLAKANRKQAVEDEIAFIEQRLEKLDFFLQSPDTAPYPPVDGISEDADLPLEEQKWGDEEEPKSAQAQADVPADVVDDWALAASAAAASGTEAEATQDQEHELVEDADGAADRQGEQEAEQGGDAVGGEDEEDEDEDEDVDDKEEEEQGMTQDEMLFTGFLFGLQNVPRTSLPMLVSTLSGPYITAYCRKLRRAQGQELRVKQTKWKKLGVFLREMEAQGIIKLAEDKPGVLSLLSIDLAHDAFVGLSEDDELVCEGADGEGQFAVTKKSKAQASQFKATKGKITICMRRIRNKNKTIVENLTKFGIHLDNDLKRALSNKFSGSVSIVEAHGQGNPQLHIQGKYVTQVAQFLKERYSIPDAFIVTNLKGVTKKDREVNV
eukprot:m.35768 g.35768  ORF g.35768 m.35768 type:complete len:652 (+) comp9920_c0_seq2:196-2151(+)